MRVVPVLIAAMLISLQWQGLMFPRTSGIGNRFSSSTAPTEAPRNSDAAETDLVERVSPALSRPELAMSAFDPQAIAEFRKSWNSVVHGAAAFESVILILRTRTGYQARRQKLTYEYKRCTFSWHPATIAVVHTHPNSCPPIPQPNDIDIADKYRVPMFTLTSRGMFLYDPATKKTTKVMDGLDWLDPQKWRERLEAGHKRL